MQSEREDPGDLAVSEMSKVITRHTLLITVLPSPLDVTSDPFCFCGQCHTQWFLKGLKNLKKMTIEGYDLRTRLYICVDVSVSLHLQVLGRGTMVRRRVFPARRRI